jgi:hypothetical protein
MVDFEDFGSDDCDCASCRPELYPAEVLGLPFTAPVDNDDDAPADVDEVFDAIFGLSDEELEALYPYNVNFNEDEIRSISAALRVQGTSLAENVRTVLNPKMDDVTDLLSDEALDDVSRIIVEALDESVKCLNLYNWFGDNFGIRE